MTYPFKFNSSLLYEQGKKMTLNVVPVSTHTHTRKHLRGHVNSLSYKQKDIHGNALFCIITCSIKCWSCMCFYFCSCICSGAEHLRECFVNWTLWYTESQDMCVFEWVMSGRLCENDGRRRTRSAARETYSWSVHFNPIPSQLAFVQLCLRSAFILFDVMLLVFALLVLSSGSCWRDFLCLPPTCNSNKTSGSECKHNRVINFLFLYRSYCSSDYTYNIHNVSSSVSFCFLQPQAVYSHNLCSLILILLYQRLLILITF